MKKKIIIVSVIILVFIILAVVLFNKKDNEVKDNSDALKFKKEYEALNNTVRESDQHKYNNVDIPKDNQIKYVDVKEAINLLENKSGIIYFGASWCPWCRNAVPVLLDAASKTGTNTIYYLDMDKVRNVYEVKDQKLVKTQVEDDNYYDLLKVLDSVLDEDTYKLTDQDGNEYDTKEKRIYMPFVVEFKEGKIIDKHEGTVSLNDDQDKYSSLTNNQKEELLEIYGKMMQDLHNDETCDADKPAC